MFSLDLLKIKKGQSYDFLSLHDLSLLPEKNGGWRGGTVTFFVFHGCSVYIVKPGRKKRSLMIRYYQDKGN